ncbi:spermidine synthase [Pseudofulvimonas gallinarii]|nr:fused MFS/spermidine synthase [Pseudofulvimonas gallinarii]
MLRLVLFATAISGAASFVYEIVWIRMLGLAVGSTQHAFELMLASFIAGIALGGLWIRKRADRSPLPLRLAGWMQIAMGLAALASLVLYANAFEWVGWLLGALSPSEGGYALFNLGTGAIAIAIMLPAAFFAGTTLPLFTVVLLRAGFGERSIGRVYAWNTMGSIVGVVAAIHLLIPMLGLKLALCVGALVDMGIGLVLLRHCVDTRPALMRLAAAAAVVFLALGVAITQVQFDPMRLASGVFRHGKSELDPSNRVVFYRDGKTASVSVIATPDGRAGIATNGKIDAGLTLSPDQAPPSDELTMILAAALPLAMHPAPEQIGIIGFGSGLTTHTSLGDPRVQRVETVEIEEAMVQGASLFMPRVHRAYGDPRSAIVIDDAKAWFASRGRQYDIIISEPSNPWVSGVGALFSTEFYEFIPQQLKADGLFVQWVQLYEVDDRLVSSVLNALTPAFGDYAAWLSNGVDLIIIATPGPALPSIDYERVLQGVLGSELAYLGITRPEQLAYRKVADARLLRAMGQLYGAPANSDYYPLLSLEAPRTRFMRRAAGGFTGLPVLRQPVLELLGIRQSLPLDVDLPLPDLFVADQRAVRARHHAQVLKGHAAGAALTPDDRARLGQFLTLVAECPIDGMALSDLEARLVEIAEAMIPHLPPAPLAELWSQSDISTCRAHSPQFDLAMAVVESTSARDPLAMRQAGEAWLSQRNNGSDLETSSAMDETALIGAMSAAAATADWTGLCTLEARFGAQVPPSSYQPSVRALLRALAGSGPADPMGAAAPGRDGCSTFALSP